MRASEPDGESVAASPRAFNIFLATCCACGLALYIYASPPQAIVRYAASDFTQPLPLQQAHGPRRIRRRVGRRRQPLVEARIERELQHPRLKLSAEVLAMFAEPPPRPPPPPPHPSAAAGSAIASSSSSRSSSRPSSIGCIIAAITQTS